MGDEIENGTLMKKRFAHYRLLTLLFLGIYVLGLNAPAAAQNKRPWKVEDTFRTKSLGDLHASPDGGDVLFVVYSRNLDENESYSRIWKWSESAGQALPLTQAEGSASSPRWSPDGDKIAFFKSDASGLGLWTMNPDGSDKQKLTNLERSNAYLQWGGLDNQLSWSPSGDRLAFSAAGPKHFENDINAPQLPTGNDVMVIDRMLHKSVYFYSDLRRTHIWTIPADGGEPQKITSGDYDYHSFSWSPDGKYIACVSNQTGRADYNANNDIMLISTTGGKDIQLTHTASPEYQVYWSPDGEQLAYKNRIRSGRSRESDAELKKIFTMPSDGGEPVNLIKPIDRWANDFQWAPSGDKVYFTVQNRGRVELYSAPDEGGSVTSIITDRGEVGDFTVVDDGTIYYVYKDFTHPDELYRLSADGNSKQKLTGFNQPLLDEVATVGVEHFTYHSFDGQQIDGWIVRPYNFKEGQQYPVVLNVHGGPHGQYDYGFSGRFQELAANGYVVLFTNPRGSTGRGQAFNDMVVGDIAGGDYQDIMTGVNYAIGRYDFIDSEHMGVTGTSYGGYMTNWINTQNNRFDAAVPVSGISNLITQWSDGANFLWYQSDMKVRPYENYDKAWDVSPMKFVQGASAPTLFINGRWDNVTSLKQANSMFMALKRLGVDTQIALYPHEGHGVHRQPKHTADYHARSIDWFDKYLK